MSLPNLALPPSLIRKCVLRALHAGLVPLVTSPPGLGKSDTIHSIAKEYRLKVIDFRVPQADVTDFNGLPDFYDVVLENGKTVRRACFCPFDIFPLEGDALPDHPDGGKYEGWILFLDELTSAPKHLQAPAYKLILDRMVGLHTLHPRVLIAAAGNGRNDKAIVHEMSTALQSRLIHFELKLDHPEWMQWAVNHHVDTRILAFLQFKPELLHRFNPDHDENTFACPRTWWFAHKLITGQVVDMEDLALIAGAVTPGVAQEFITFIKVFDELPKLADIIADPEHIVIPHEPSIKYALSTVLADKMDERNAAALCTFLGRMPVECRVLCMRMLRQRTPTLIRDPAVQRVFQPILARM